jgi:isoamylase
MTTPWASVWPGKSSPLGARWDGSGVNFALFSEHAEAVELCLFDATGRHETRRIRCRSDRPGLALLPARCTPGQLYGYRVTDPMTRSRDTASTRRKLLLDPYAKSIQGRLQLERPPLRLPDRARRAQTSRSTDRDDARDMPKCRGHRSRLHLGRRRPPRTPWHETVIYELHVKGFTAQHPTCPPAARHLRRARDPAGDRLPPGTRRHRGRADAGAQLRHERHLVEQGLRNYWGYNSIGFFAPDNALLGQRVMPVSSRPWSRRCTRRASR